VAAGHRQERWRPQLEGDDAGADVERGHLRGDRPEQGKCLGTDHFGRPERAVAEVSGPAGHGDGVGGRNGALE
jgi:hypothetical protein